MTEMKGNRLFDVNGSPCYPSPLDRLRTGKRERAAQFGLCDEDEESFECNQSFPRANLHHHHHHGHSNKHLTPEPGAGGFLNHSLDLNPAVYFRSDLLKNAQNLKIKSNIQNLKTFRLNCLLNDTSMNNNASVNMTAPEKSWIFYNHLVNTDAAAGQQSTMPPGGSNENAADQIVTVTNPNKALITINGRTSEILTANNISCDLFGYNESQLIGMKLTDLFDVTDLNAQQPPKRPQDLLMESDKLDKNGRVVLCPGKIFDAITIDQSKQCLKNIEEHESNEDDGQEGQNGGGSDQKKATAAANKLIMPVSMYMLKLTDEKEPKCLCVIEPVQRVQGKFSINLKGRIRTYDSNFSYIFGYTPSSQAGNESQSAAGGPSTLSKMATTSILTSKDINTLIPSMRLPLSAITPEIRRQTLTGRTCSGENIPISVSVLNKQLFNNEEIVYNCTVSVYTNISGLVTVRPSDFKINSYNPTFARLLFGFGEKELIDKPITALIPNFFEPDLNTTAFTSNRYVTPMSHSMLTAMGASTDHHGGNRSFRKKAANMHGSFLESNNGGAANHSTRLSTGPKRVSISSVTPLKKAPQALVPAPNVFVTDTEKGSQQNIAKQVEFEPEVSKSKPCVSCGQQFKPAAEPAAPKVTAPAVKTEENEIVAQFDLKILDYSPTKKCVQFIEESNFAASSGSAANTPEHHQQQISSAKKGSLLAKAIANNKNANDKVTANMSLDEMSIASSSSAASSDQAAVKANSFLSASTLSHVNVSEFEGEEMCGACKSEPEQQQEAATVAMATNVKFQVAAASGGHPETHEVSLINMTTEADCDDGHATEDEYVDFSTAHINATSKRKMTGECEDMLLMYDGDENRRPSVILQSNLTTLTENNQEEATTGAEKSKKFKNQVTSTPAASKINKLGAININTNVDSPRLGGKPSPTESIDGLFFGRGRHTDGSLIRIFYQRKLVKIAAAANESGESDNDQLICVWISRDPYADKSMLECSMDQSQLLKSTNRHLQNQTMNENNDYLNEYEPVRTFGRGASGFVQLAQRRTDNFKVVTKYILKSKIYKDNWIDDSRYGCIPLEISILCKLDHKNIIKVIEVFQDADHVQMVMEKHGCGMDLFEFIDRQRKPTAEKLGSYIFRQLISAVSYLHANSIVHRDIKDENIVINENFHIKLIDFGSAAYVHKGKQFATFCGTLDYCAPEVLLGNKYYGPEVDAWTCGITLYTLIFSENPFVDAEETIECILKPPFKVSKELTTLLFSILCPKPDTRMSIEEIENYPWVNQEVDISEFKWENVIRNTEFHSNDAGDCRGDYLPANSNGNAIKEPLGQLDLNQANNKTGQQEATAAAAATECLKDKKDFLQVNPPAEFAGFLSKSF